MLHPSPLCAEQQAAPGSFSKKFSWLLYSSGPRPCSPPGPTPLRGAPVQMCLERTLQRHFGTSPLTIARVPQAGCSLPSFPPTCGAGRAEVLHLKHPPASMASPGGCGQLCPYGNKLSLRAARAPSSTSPSAWSQQICLRTDTASQREGCFFLFFLPFFEEAPAFWSRKAVAPSTAAALSPALYLPQQPRGNISARRKKTLRRNDAAHQLHKVQLINYTATEPCPCSGTARGGCSVPPCVPSQLHPEQTQPEERAINNHVCRTPFTFLNRAR